METIEIRPARPADAGDVVRLAEQLGYPSDERRVRSLLERLTKDPRHRLWVAEMEGRVLGWIEAEIVETATSPAEVLITGLVVQEESRGAGIGARLAAAVEDWARLGGQSGVRVRSQVKRAEAHRFYERLGYELVKTQAVFRKDV